VHSARSAYRSPATVPNRSRQRGPLPAWPAAGRGPRPRATRPSGWGAAPGSGEAMGPAYEERGGGEVAWHQRSGGKQRRVRR
jgi:hypothetical protein